VAFGAETIGDAFLFAYGSGSRIANPMHAQSGMRECARIKMGSLVVMTVLLGDLERFSVD